ncbi:MAG: glycoside hydrolase family 3 C-terminal domain-containing protein [Lachnospiraceae bacterium]|nr:glycoside hydrolase family 3 C-terminal domain-containing protein [Lachnospiraceae bacterium]
MKNRPGLILFSIFFALATLAAGVLCFWSSASNYISHSVLSWDPETVRDRSLTYSDRSYTTYDQVLAHSRETAIRLQAAGTVLLENNGALPLAENERRISVFGTACVDPVFGGTGSGNGNGAAGSIGLLEALEEEGFTVNPVLKDLYGKLYKQGYRRGEGTDMNGAFTGRAGSRSYGYSVNEAELSLYTAEVRASYASYADAAIVVIARSGGEGQDLPTDMRAFYEADDRHYLELTEEEEALIRDVQNGPFGKVIVILNTLNTFECGFLKENGPDAALWIGGPGQYGMRAVARILTGALSPEGRLPDTYARDLLSAPAMQNYGDNRYTENGAVTTAAYVAYAEGIYVGYRYYETRALAEGEAWYAQNVVYPFGYGLGYTTFEWSGATITETASGFQVTVNVTNTGTRAGRDTVQLYLTKPYTDYDRTNRLEKSAVDLAAFTKTSVLTPGQSERVSLLVDRSQLASYDTYGTHTYLAEAGEYLFRLSRNAHEAVFSLPWRLEADRLFDKSVTGYPVTNRFETETYSSLPDDLRLLSRSDWAGTWPAVYGDGGEAGHATKVMTAEKKAAILSKDHLGPNTDQVDYIYNTRTGKTETVTIEKPVTSSGQRFSFSDLFDENGKPYDFYSSIWQRVVECMSPRELYHLVSAGAAQSPAIASINKNQSITSDSPMGLHIGTLFPCYPIQAATWSTELAGELGRCIAEEALWNDIRGWYAPAMDTHRTPFGGRNYEYYSEDGLLAGNYAQAVIRTAKEGGLYFHIKHFALNDQDTNRGDRGNFKNADPYNGLCTYAGEQSIREIYLKPFEIAVTKGGATGVMTAYNRIGDTWAGGHYGLLTEVLRNEWGLHGNVLTDFAGTFGYTYMDMDQGLRAGGSQWLYVGDYFPIDDKSSDAAIYYMQKAAKEILYAEASSSRVNNQRINDGTSVRVSVRPQRWQWVAGGIYVALAGLYGWFLYTSLKPAEKPRKK